MLRTLSRPGGICGRETELIFQVKDTRYEHVLFCRVFMALHFVRIPINLTTKLIRCIILQGRVELIFGLTFSVKQNTNDHF